MNYSGNRNLRASDLYGLYVDHLVAARDRVAECYFYRKASQWKYEKEWRHIRNGNGLSASPYLISGIYFGMRCELSIESMIVRLFQEAEHKPRFYTISEDIKTFKLRRQPVDIDDLLYDSPAISDLWREKKILEMFEDESPDAKTNEEQDTSGDCTRFR